MVDFLHSEKRRLEKVTEAQKIRSGLLSQGKNKSTQTSLDLILNSRGYSWGSHVCGPRWAKKSTLQVNTGRAIP